MGHLIFSHGGILKSFNSPATQLHLLIKHGTFENFWAICISVAGLPLKTVNFFQDDARFRFFPVLQM